jgi:hypothetical protein
MSDTMTMTSTISSGVSNTLRRTSSLVNVLKSLANGIAFPSLLDDRRASPTISTHVHFQPEVADISHPPSPNLSVAQYASPYSRPATPQGGYGHGHGGAYRGFSQMFIPNFADGTIKVFERRLEGDEAIVRSFFDHTSWVQNVRYHPKLSGRFLSARSVSMSTWSLRH